MALYIFHAHSVVWYSAAISLLSLLPAILGSELGFRRWYIRFLVDLFDWATLRLGRADQSFEEDEGNVFYRNVLQGHSV